jgi:twinkle protein
MAGKCVEKLPHSCGTRNGLQVFEKDDGSYDGYCYSCKAYVPDPYKNKPDGYKPPEVVKKTPEEIQQELREIKECEALALPSRRLRKETLEHFLVKVGVQGEDGVTPSLVYFPAFSEGKLSGCSVRLLEPKRQWSIGTTSGTDLFGWNKAVKSGSKTLYITEGQFDAMALHQIIVDHNANTQYAQNAPAVTSLVHGAGSAVKDISRLYPRISKIFKEVVLVFDMDAAGRKAVEDVMAAVHKVKDTDAVIKTADLPEKDANECLLKGKSKACFNSVVFNAQKPKNTRLVYGSQLREAARKEAEWGLSYPWKGLTEATRGIRLGETIYLGAG